MDPMAARVGVIEDLMTKMRLEEQPSDGLDQNPDAKSPAPCQ
jgi:hypothetical protein